MATLRPTGGTTYCTIETGKFSNTWDGYTTTSCCFKRDQTCLSEWYWDTPVNVTKFNILSLYYYPNSRINGIWGRVNGGWVELWHDEWKPSHNAWDGKAISCDNCTGIRISQTHIPQPSRPCITEVTVDYEEVVAEGEAEIVSVTAPSSFTPSVSFAMGVVLKNIGSGADMLLMKIINDDTGDVLCDRSIYVNPGDTAPALSCIINLTQTTDFHGRIEAGHVENGIKVVDDTEDITIPVERICTEGTRDILERCWDGSVKRERVCENNKWVEYEYTCPPEPPPPPPPVCSEGDREILEYCPDGYTVKRERVCENGEWREYTYTCPPEPECSEGAREVLEFCPDGYTVKRERICENGEWREYTYTCPPEPECTEGMEEVLEYCPDGFTIKRTRRCENGQWVYYDYTCPPEEEGIIEAFLRMIRELFGLE